MNLKFTQVGFLTLRVSINPRISLITFEFVLFSKACLSRIYLTYLFPVKLWSDHITCTNAFLLSVTDPSEFP